MSPDVPAFKVRVFTSDFKFWRVGKSTTDIHLLQFKIQVTCKNPNFECWYIKNHTEEKSFKISNIKLAILPFSIKKKKKYPNQIAILSTL